MATGSYFPNCCFTESTSHENRDCIFQVPYRQALHIMPDVYLIFNKNYQCTLLDQSTLLEDAQSQSLLSQKVCSKTTDQWEEEGTVSISCSAHPMLVHSTMTRCTPASVSKGTGRDPNRQRAESSQCWSWQRPPSGTTVSREKNWVTSHSNAEIGLFLTSATGMLGTTTSHPHFVQPAALMTTLVAQTQTH